MDESTPENVQTASMVFSNLFFAFSTSLPAHYSGVPCASFSSCLWNISAYRRKL